jgi:TonB family protein
VNSMARVANQPTFRGSLLPEAKNRFGSFGAGFGVQIVALAVVIVIPLMFPEKFEVAPHYWVTPIETPVIQPWKPQPPPKPAVVKKAEVAKAVPKSPEVVLPKPKIYNPVVSAPVVKQVRRPAPELAEVAKVFPDQNPLSLGSSAPPTLRKPREAVQTGGFGDPNSVPDNNNKNRNPNMTAQGSFDLPTGAGTGNGTGGARGAKGVTASAGFGNGVAAGTPGGGSRGGVQQGVFASEEPSAAPRVKQTAAVSNTKPVEVLFKPKPAYTTEARTKKIEGDVLLQVVFTASGEVKVEKIVQGLGYGLDESAEAAARQIRYHPALQDGQPVDYPAVVHITFELAY